MTMTFMPASPHVVNQGAATSHLLANADRDHVKDGSGLADPTAWSEENLVGRPAAG
jgi:hypothetical protein